MEKIDVLVVGGGIAGLSAALFSARAGHSTVVLDGGIVGGQLVNINRIEAFPGFPDGVAGYELCPLIQEQATEHGALLVAAMVQLLERRQHDWLVDTDGGEIEASAVVLATGCRIRALGIPGEARLFGRGVSSCASCDAPLWSGQTVGVVGGGDSALQEALELADQVGRVIIFHRRPQITGQRTYWERVARHPRIEIRFDTEILEVLGDESVEAVMIRDTKTSNVEDVELRALFPYPGLEPRTPPVKGLKLDVAGKVETDDQMWTGLPGLFAAGSVRSRSVVRAVAAAGEGTAAALAASRFLDSKA